MIQANAAFSCGCKQGENVGGVVRRSLILTQTFFYASAKNQGLSITKNSASTTLHSDQSYGASQGSSNARFNVETTAINGYQTTKNELDIAMLQILDPHLRPVPPAPKEPTSQKIYKEHMDLAQEYFKVSRDVVRVSLDLKLFLSFLQNQTEIAYLTKNKESLLQGMSSDERKLRQDICNKLKEKVKKSVFHSTYIQSGKFRS